MKSIVPIVEGHGEIQAFPLLIKRLAKKHGDHGNFRINSPIFIKAGSFFHDASYFQKYIQLAAEKAAQSHGQVFILLDCEDVCPAEAGPRLLKRAEEIRSDVPFQVFLAYREFETWFITAIESLRGLYGIPKDAQPPKEPERIRDAKGWLTERMVQAYDPIRHQSEFTNKMDLDVAEGSASFRRLSLVVSQLTQGKKPS